MAKDGRSILSQYSIETNEKLNERVNDNVRRIVTERNETEEVQNTTHSLEHITDGLFKLTFDSKIRGIISCIYNLEREREKKKILFVVRSYLEAGCKH